MCNRLDEDGAHLFFKCKEAKAAWRELNLERIRCALTEAGSARGVMETILKLKGKEQLTVILLLWMWWNERNKRRENGRKHTPAEVAYMAAAYAENYLRKETEMLLPVNRQSPSWEKPPGGWCKVNSDGAFHKENKSGGWGYVIRDDQGQVLKAGAGFEDFLLSVLHAEPLGCAARIQEASRLGIENLCIETDASLLKEVLESNGYRLSEIGGIVTEMKVQLAADLSSRFIIVCNRVSNRVAHSLAAIGCKFPSRQYVTWEGVPHELEALVISDLADANE